MSVKDILVQVDGTHANSARLDLAVQLARRHGANLIGLCMFDVGLVQRSANMVLINPNGTLALLTLEQQLREEALAIATNLEADFNSRLRREGIAGEWRLAEGRAAMTVSLQARYCDLAVLGQEDPDDARLAGWTTVLESALLTSGRPILVVPLSADTGSSAAAS